MIVPMPSNAAEIEKARSRRAPLEQLRAGETPLVRQREQFDGLVRERRPETPTKLAETHCTEMTAASPGRYVSLGSL